MSARPSQLSWPKAAISRKTRPSWSPSISSRCRRVVDPEAALKPGAPVLHDKYGTNLIGEFRITKGDVEGALARAPHRLKRRFHHHRYAAIPMECRGVVSVYDERADAMTIWSSVRSCTGCGAKLQPC